MIGRGSNRNKNRPSFLHVSVDEPLAVSSYKIKKTSTLILENRITTSLNFLFSHQDIFTLPILSPNPCLWPPTKGRRGPRRLYWLLTRHFLPMVIVACLSYCRILPDFAGLRRTTAIIKHWHCVNQTFTNQVSATYSWISWSPCRDLQPGQVRLQRAASFLPLRSPSGWWCTWEEQYKNCILSTWKRYKARWSEKIHIGAAFPR